MFKIDKNLFKLDIWINKCGLRLVIYEDPPKTFHAPTLSPTILNHEEQSIVFGVAICDNQNCVPTYFASFQFYAAYLVDVLKAIKLVSSITEIYTSIHFDFSLTLPMNLNSSAISNDMTTGEISTFDLMKSTEGHFSIEKSHLP